MGPARELASRQPIEGVIVIALSLLGPPELVIDGRTLHISRPRERTVLCVLAINHNRVAPVEELVDSLWPDSPPETARNQVQICVSRLRRILGQSGGSAEIHTRPPGYVLDIDPADLDTAEFARLAVAGRQAAEAGRLDESAETLRQALALWRGPAYAGVRSDHVQREASALDEERLGVLEQLMRLDVELGRHEAAVGPLTALAQQHPLREPFAELLMLALYRSGRQAEALDVARHTRTTMLDELGVEPGPSLQHLTTAILQRDPGLEGGPRASMTPPVTVQRETGPVPRQLPRSIEDFTARGSQIAQLARILTDDTDDADDTDGGKAFAATIVALTGKGGVGKSTLAVRIAHEVAADYPDGQLYADLHGPGGDVSPDSWCARFLRALGVSGAAVPRDGAERLDLYRSRLAGKRILVVLDGATSEAQVVPLLPTDPTCSAVVTSRVRLVELSGAHQIQVPEFAEAEAAALLTRIVGDERVAAEPAATAELVDACGGLPLAVRIAGARLASRSHWRVANLVERLVNRTNALDEFEHRGLALRANVALSFDALDEPAQRLFALSALVETADFPAWVAAALMDTAVADAEDVLADLVDAQLMDTRQHAGARVEYRLHELVRLYAREQLARVPAPVRDAALQRLLGGWLAFAERSYRAAYGSDDYCTLHGSAIRWHPGDPLDAAPTAGLEEITEVDRESLVAAVRQAAQAGADELCWDLALTAIHVFEVRGYFDDWRETAQRALAVCDRAGNRTGRAAMLYSLGSLHTTQRRLDDGERYFAEALDEFRAIGNTHAIALVLRTWAIIDRLRGRYGAMSTKYGEALVKMRSVGDTVGEAHVLQSLALPAIHRGDAAHARELLDEALRLCRSVGYRRGQAMVHARSAELNLDLGAADEAEQDLDRAIRIVRELRDRPGEAQVLYLFGVLRRSQGRADESRVALEQSLAIAGDVGERMLGARALLALGGLDVDSGHHTDGLRHLESARDTFTAIGVPLWRAKALRILATAYAGIGDLERADRDIAEADRLETAPPSLDAGAAVDTLSVRGRAFTPDEIVTALTAGGVPVQLQGEFVRFQLTYGGRADAIDSDEVSWGILHRTPRWLEPDRVHADFDRDTSTWQVVCADSDPSATMTIDEFGRMYWSGKLRYHHYDRCFAGDDPLPTPTD